MRASHPRHTHLVIQRRGQLGDMAGRGRRSGGGSDPPRRCGDHGGVTPFSVSPAAEGMTGWSAPQKNYKQYGHVNILTNYEYHKEIDQYGLTNTLKFSIKS